MAGQSRPKTILVFSISPMASPGHDYESSSAPIITLQTRARRRGMKNIMGKVPEGVSRAAAAILNTELAELRGAVGAFPARWQGALLRQCVAILIEDMNEEERDVTLNALKVWRSVSRLRATRSKKPKSKN
jgi:hypothetical protein